MARFMNKLMVLGVAAAMAMPGIGFAGGAPQVNTSAPMGMGMPSVQMPANFNMLNGLGSLGAGGLAGMNIGQMLQTALTQAITQLTSQLLGQIGGGMLGQVAGGMAGQGLGGMLGQGGTGIGGISTGGLTSSFGGLQGATDSLSGSFGGLVQSVAQGAINGAVQTGLQQILGGIQGGSSSSGSSSGSGSLGGVGLGNIGGNTDVTTEQPTLNANAAIDPSTINYQAGLLDAARGNGPDTTFVVMTYNNTIVWDSNYWAGYQKALIASR